MTKEDNRHHHHGKKDDSGVLAYSSCHSWDFTVISQAKNNDDTTRRILEENNDKKGSFKNSNNNTKSYCNKIFSSVNDFRLLCGKAVNNSTVQLILVVLIILNAITMGIGLTSLLQDNEHIAYILSVVDFIFLIIFTIELSFQFIYLGYKLIYDGWLVFDAVIITLSWLLDGLSALRALRVLRILRLITRLKPLRSITNALFDVMPRMSAIVALLVLILYIYAVLCTVLFGDCYKDGITEIDYFSTLFKSLLTLFQMLTLEWADIVREMQHEFPYAWTVFGTFLIASAFILYSLVVAVVCDAVAVTEHQDDTELIERDKEEIQQRMEIVYQSIDDITNQQNQLIRLLQQKIYMFNHDDKNYASRYNNKNDDKDGSCDTTKSGLASSSSKNKNISFDFLSQIQGHSPKINDNNINTSNNNDDRDEHISVCFIDNDINPVQDQNNDSNKNDDGDNKHDSDDYLSTELDEEQEIVFKNGNEKRIKPRTYSTTKNDNKYNQQTEPSSNFRGGGRKSNITADLGTTSSHSGITSILIDKASNLVGDIESNTFFVQQRNRLMKEQRKHKKKKRKKEKSSTSTSREE